MKITSINQLKAEVEKGSTFYVGSSIVSNIQLPHDNKETLSLFVTLFGETKPQCVFVVELDTERAMLTGGIPNIGLGSRVGSMNKR